MCLKTSSKKGPGKIPPTTYITLSRCCTQEAIGFSIQDATLILGKCSMLIIF